jgi:hypothetical protein
MNPREIQAAGGVGKWNDDRFVLDGWTSFLVSVRGRGEATARRYRRLVERLLADAGKPVTQLGREDVERHLRRLHVAGRGESVRQGVVVAVRSLGGVVPGARDRRGELGRAPRCQARGPTGARSRCSRSARCQACCGATSRGPYTRPAPVLQFVLAS